MATSQNDDDDFDFPVLSDTEAAVAFLLGDCPLPALLHAGAAGGPASPIPCVLVHALYTIVHHASEVDQELNRLRLKRTLRVIKLPAAGDEQLLLREEDYERALRAVGSESARRCADALPRLTKVAFRSSELAEALGSTAAQIKACEELQRDGWLVAAVQSAATDEWLWGMPSAGRLLYSLVQCRMAVLGVLQKQKFARAMRYVVERAPAVTKALRQHKLDLSYVLRDLRGKELVLRTETTAGEVLELTPAGVQLAAASRGSGSDGKKRARS